MTRPTSAVIASDQVHHHAVIALDQVHKHYDMGGRRVQALDGVDLRIQPGELVAIVGPSGSGKSTLLDVMGALHRPSSGGVQVAGVDIAGLDDRGLAALRAHRIGFVFQQFHLLDGMTAVQNVAAGLIYRGLPARERTRRALEALAQVDLADRAHHRPDQLSGGESQRVAVARALVGDPDILLADEPTGNLDTATGQRIVDLFTRLNGAGATIVVITHDRDLAARLPRRVDLRDGRIVADAGMDGTPATAAPLTEVGP